MLQHMEHAITDELDEDFVDEVENAVKAIYSQLPLKYIGSSTMMGLSFVKFLQNIVERMNSSENSTILSVPSEYESVMQFVAQEAINEAIGKYIETMKKKLPILWEEFEKVHSECVKEAENLFFEKIINSTKIEIFRKQLNEKISKLKEKFIKRNSKELKAYNENIAEKLWEKYIEIGFTLENLFKVRLKKNFFFLYFI
jgi:guanylate-binding protein 1/3/4/7